MDTPYAEYNHCSDYGAKDNNEVSSRLSLEELRMVQAMIGGLGI